MEFKLNSQLGCSPEAIVRLVQKLSLASIKRKQKITPVALQNFGAIRCALNYT